MSVDNSGMKNGEESMSMAEIESNVTAGYAFPGYFELTAERERVDDCLKGQWHIKQKKDKYLPKDRWQKKNNEDYLAYLERALFYNYTRKTLNRYVGMLDMGEPDISIANARMDFFRDCATQYGDGLKALQRRINTAQIKHGLICLLLESTGDDKYPFVIQTYRADNFLNVYYMAERGKSYAKFVLLDESSFEYNLKTKQYEFSPRLRVLGLDRNGKYYQVGITFGEWKTFNVDYPASTLEEVIYPSYRGALMNRIPFTWCGASGLSGSSFDEPPILNIANAEISLYQLYADFRQVLFMTGQSPLFISGLKGSADQIRETVKSIFVNSGAVNAIPSDAKAGYLEMAGNSLSIILKEIETLKELCSSDALSLSQTRSNQSGVAVQLIQDSNTAPLQVINSTAGNAITEQLRYAARWMGLNEKEILETRYTPSKDFAEANLSVQELISLENSKVLTFAEVRQVFTENGYGDGTKTPEQVFEELEEDRVRTAQSNPIIQQAGNPFVSTNRDSDDAGSGQDVL